MPLEPNIPQLDSPDFETLYRQLLLRAQRYNPEWTDFNESDPGVTLLQLVAWLTEGLKFSMNQVPERNYLKFLQLLNLELEPAQPATAHLVFTANPDVPQNPGVPQRTPIAGQSPDGDQFIFETEEGIDLIRMPLAHTQVFDGNSFIDETLSNEEQDATFQPFGWRASVGSALYLGFAPPREPVGRPFPTQMRFRVFLTPTADKGRVPSSREMIEPPAPPVRLVWEYQPTGSTRWRQLSVYRDDSSAFTREGYIIVEAPRDIEPMLNVGEITDPMYWVRCRIYDGNYPAGTVPEIAYLRSNVVPAISLTTVRNEIVEISNGLPKQRVSLQNAPVQAKTLKLELTEPDGEPEMWEQLDDLLAADPDKACFILNATAGEIRFGDGTNGRIPLAGTEIVALEYRYGGGKAANLDPGLINAPQVTLIGVDEVTNVRPAVGGADEQTVTELRKRAPSKLRSRGRGVSAEDLTELAKQAGGVARATAIGLMNPNYRGVDVPGAVTVVIVPDNKDIPPRPSTDQRRSVAQYLNDRRMLTTELYVVGPQYTEIKVEALVHHSPYAAPDAVKEAVIKAINYALNSPQRPFGQDFNPSTLYDVIYNVPDVRNAVIHHVYANGTRHTISEQVEIEPDGLVYGFDHDIAMTPYEDR